MNQAQITRLMTFAQHGQPKGYAASDMMRSDLEAILTQTAESATEVSRLREGWAASIVVCESLQKQLAEYETPGRWTSTSDYITQCNITNDLREQLAERSKAEPVAYIAWRDGKPCYEGDDVICENAVWPVDGDDDREAMPVYTAPQAVSKAEPMADETGFVGFQEWWDSVADDYEVTYFKPMRSAWNAALKYEAPQPEPVNQQLLEALKLAVKQNEHDMLLTGEELRNGEPWGRDLIGDNLVYWMLVEVDRLKQVIAVPPQQGSKRTALTDVEIDSLITTNIERNGGYHQFARAIEAAHNIGGKHD